MGSCVSLVRGDNDPHAHLKPAVERQSVGQWVAKKRSDIKDQLILPESARWRNTDVPADLKDVISSTTLPEFVDNVDSIIKARKDSVEDAYRDKVSPQVDKARRRMSDGMDAVTRLVVSPKKDPRKKPPPPAPPPKKGADGKHAQVKVAFSPAHKAAADRDESSPSPSGRRSLQDQLTPTTALEEGGRKSAAAAKRAGYQPPPARPVAVSPGGASYIEHAKNTRPAPKTGAGVRRGSTTAEMDGGAKHAPSTRVRRASTIEVGGGGGGAAGVIAPKKAVNPKGGVMNEFVNPGAANAVVKARRNSLPGFVTG